MGEMQWFKLKIGQDGGDKTPSPLEVCGDVHNVVVCWCIIFFFQSDIVLEHFTLRSRFLGEKDTILSLTEADQILNYPSDVICSWKKR